MSVASDERSLARKTCRWPTAFCVKRGHSQSTDIVAICKIAFVEDDDLKRKRMNSVSSVLEVRTSNTVLGSLNLCFITAVSPR
jgi:hypothetical protein